MYSHGGGGGSHGVSGGGGHHPFATSNDYWLIWEECKRILNIKFDFFGNSINLWQVIAFDIVVFLVTYWIIELFERK